MKNEINTILGYLECEREMILSRDQLLSLSALQAAELQQTIANLEDAIRQINIQSHKFVGFYYLFLGCAYYEQDKFQQAASSVQNAANELWGVPVNKALARWLLGLCYSSMQDFPRARNELQEALNLLATHIGTNSPRTEKEHRSRQPIRQSIKDALDRLFNEPLFRAIRPDSPQSDSRFPVQNPPVDENDTPSISLGLPISITIENYPYINSPVTLTNENNPTINVPVTVTNKNNPAIDVPVTVTNENNPAINVPVTMTNENYPAIDIPVTVPNENYFINKLSFNPPPPDVTVKVKPETTEGNYENRTDDDGYLVIQSVPVYEEYARAGKTGEPEPVISKDQFAEFHQVNIEDKLYTIHSLRSKSNRVNVIKEGSWGWIKVKGESMNDIKGKVSINDGDYVLFQRNPSADDNDIVLAVRNDDFSTHVKRLRKFEKTLLSETNKKGSEYEPIDMEEKNMKIAGIVYAVAKPIPS
jgi:hypothetical protein